MNVLLFLDGRLLPINRKQKVFPNGTLIIENVERASDQATYVCVAKNSQGYSARGSLEVQVMGEFFHFDWYILSFYYTCYICLFVLAVSYLWKGLKIDDDKINEWNEQNVLGYSFSYTMSHWVVEDTSKLTKRYVKAGFFVFCAHFFCGLGRFLT